MDNQYELLYLIPANFSDDEIVPIKDKVRQILEKSQVKITFDDSLGKKKLSYPIKTARHAHYLLVEFNAEPAEIKKIDRELKLTNEVIRHLIVRRESRAPAFRQITDERPKKIEEPEKKRPESDEKEKEKDKEKDKVKLEDLDQKLDEILEGNIL